MQLQFNDFICADWTIHSSRLTAFRVNQSQAPFGDSTARDCLREGVSSLLSLLLSFFLSHSSWPIHQVISHGNHLKIFIASLTIQTYRIRQWPLCHPSIRCTYILLSSFANIFFLQSVKLSLSNIFKSLYCPRYGYILITIWIRSIEMNKRRKLFDSDHQSMIEIHWFDQASYLKSCNWSKNMSNYHKLIWININIAVLRIVIGIKSNC